MNRCTILLLIVLAVAAQAAPLEVSFVRQQENGCGAASIAMVMDYWSVVADPARVYQDLFRDEDSGILLADMRDYARDAGLQAFSFRGTTADLEEQLGKGRPVVVALKKGPKADYHFVVIVGLDEQHAWLNDPAKKKPRRMKRSRFEKRWAAGDEWMLLVAPREEHESQSVRSKRIDNSVGPLSLSSVSFGNQVPVPQPHRVRIDQFSHSGTVNSARSARGMP